MNHRRRTANFINTVLLFTVAFVLGIAVTLGSIIGGIYAALTYVSIDRVEELLGVDIADGVLTEDSALRSLSIIGLVGEVIEISGNLSATTFNSLMAQYGVIVSDGVRDYIPDGLVDLPFSELTGDDAVHVLLSHIMFGDIFEISGDVLPTALAEKLASRTVDLAVEKKFDRLLEGVYLGDIIDVALEVREDGLAYPVVPEGERPRVVDHLATLDLGAFFAAEDTAAKDTVLNNTLGRVPLSDLLVEEDGFFADSIADKTLGDILIIEDMSFRFSMDPLLDGLYLGNILGYHEVYDETDGTFLYWADKNETPAKGIYRELVDVSINDLGDTDVMAKIDNVYVAELMNYEREEIGVDENGDPIYRFYQYDENGNQVEPGGMIADLVVLKVGELRNENTLDEQIRNLKIGVVMGYEEDENGRWYQLDAGGAKVYASGVMRPLLGSTIDTIDEDMDRLYLGQVMGYDILRNEDGLAVDKYGVVIEDENGVITGEPVFIMDDNNDGVLADTESTPGALLAEFVSLKLDDINDDSKFTARVKNVRVGNAMGYIQNTENGKWYQEKPDGTLVPVTGIFASLADSKVNELDGSVKTLRLSDALGYTFDDADGKWKKPDPNNPAVMIPAAGVLQILMGSTLDTLSEDSKSVYVGQIMGYSIKTNSEGKAVDKNGNVIEDENGVITGTPVFYKLEGGVEVAPMGVTAEFVDLTVQDLENDAKIGEKIDNMKVGTAMGYKEVDGVWLDAYNQPAAGFMELIGPGTKIKDLGGSVSAVEEKPIQSFIDAGILNIDDATISALDRFFGGDGWEERTNLTAFVDGLVNAVKLLPVS